MKEKLIRLQSVGDKDLDEFEGILAITKGNLLFYGFSRESLKFPYSCPIKQTGIRIKIKRCRVGNRLKLSLADKKGEIFNLISEEVVERILAWPKSAGEEG